MPARVARSRLRHVASCLSHQRLGATSSTSAAASSAASGDGGVGAASEGGGGRPGRVLAIQSHIVHGNLGNKCAVFPLQLLGYEVDNISTVQYSHMGAGRQGTILSGEQLTALIDGLEANGLLGTYSHILTGWAADAGLLRAVAAAVRRVRKANPAAIYVCDPVLGDNGSLYTPDGLAAIYRDELVPQAHVVTPNAFEAELLTGSPCTTEEEGLAACAALHAAGPTNVAITSIEQAETVALLGSSTAAEGQRSFRIDVPKIEGYFGGTGDLLAGLLLAHGAAHPADWARAARLAVGSVQAVLARTLEARRAAGDEAGHGGLELVASSGVILSPPASGPIFSDGWIAKRPAPDQETRRPWRRLLTGEAH